MHKSTRTLLIAASVAVAIGTAGYASAGDSVSQDLSDARQETQIWTTYALSPYLRAHELKVSVHSGKATLSGTVAEDVNKDLAKQIALGVDGVTEVDNRIVVDSAYAAPARSASGERSFGEVIDDATITTAVKSKLLWSRQTEGFAIDVDTRSQAVVLKGTVDSAEARNVAGRLAGNTRDVRSVDNRLVVGSAATAAVGTTGSIQAAMAAPDKPVDDAWITTRVKSTFMYSDNVDASDIDVSTSSGSVTLSGKVGSGAERALAIELAENVRGVKAVQSRGLTY